MNDMTEDEQLEYDEADRVIPHFWEKAYRLVAGEFSGMTLQNAAKVLKITPKELSRVLKEFEQKAPQLFPLVTKPEYETLELLKEGLLISDIARTLGVDKATIDRRIESLIRKKRWAHDKKTIRYAPYMDTETREKF
jgi:DNA-binding NarL/FixJ family response regulator